MRDFKEKEAAIREYLAGGISSVKLGEKYGCSHTTISRWVMAKKQDHIERQEQLRAEHSVRAKKDMPTDIKELQEALLNSQLKVGLLEAMIDISDEQFGTDIRKKAGTRQS